MAAFQRSRIRITRARLALAFSLVFIWWLAHLFRSHRPEIQSALRSRIGEASQRLPGVMVDWQYLDNPSSPYNPAKAALLIEARPIPHLTTLILHMITVVPPDWKFIFIGSARSIASVSRSRAIHNQQSIGKLDLVVLPELWRIDSKEHVNRLLTDVRFYDDYLPGVEWILKYEWDSILCANSEQSLDEWLDWSWAGAPRIPNDRFSGNGGLSLRRVSTIKRVLAFQERWNDTWPEDEWFGRRLWTMPDEKVATGFRGNLAVEDVFQHKPMGYHVRDGGHRLSRSVWQNPAQRQDIFLHCPELSMVMDMKLERERCANDNLEGGFRPTGSL